MVRNKFIYISFLILFLHSAKASNVEKIIPSNDINNINNENNIFDNNLDNNFDNNFDIVTVDLIKNVTKLHNEIIFNRKKENFTDPLIKSFAKLSTFLTDYKENFKCYNDVTELANFICKKIVEPSKKKEQTEKISNFLYRLCGDLNIFCEKFDTIQQNNENGKSTFCAFLRDLLNEEEIDGVLISVSLLKGKRPHFNIKTEVKSGEKYDFSNLLLKVLKNKNETVVCTKWNGNIINTNEKDNAFSSLLGKNKNSFSICFPKHLDPATLNIVVYDRKKEREIIFNF